MPRFFICGDQIEDNRIKIVGDDAFHISRSLRMAAGEHITVCDEEGREYDCALEAFLPDSVIASIISSGQSDTEPPFRAHVFQGLPKGDKLETVIQKAVECGAYSITPFESDFCIAKSKPDAEEKRTERRLRIAAEAAKQCGRGILPRVSPTLSFRGMIEAAAECDLVIFCYEGDSTQPISRAIATAREILTEKQALDVAIVVGSEGGFSEKEAEMAKNAGFSMCGLGKRILRTETAAAFALGCLVYEFELV